MKKSERVLFVLLLLGLGSPCKARGQGPDLPGPAGAEITFRASNELAQRTETGWVVLQNQSPVDPSTLCPVLYLAGEERSDLTRRIVTGDIAVDLALGVDAAALASEWGLADAGESEIAAPLRVFQATPPARALEVIDALRRDPRVALAELCLARWAAPRGLPNDPLLAQQWNLKNTSTGSGGAGVSLNVENAWGDFAQATGTRGRGVRVGVIDSGIDYAHPEFQGKIDFDSSADWNTPSAEYPGAAQTQGNIHGTSVAGLIAAAADNGQGIAGVAPAASLVSLRLTADAMSDIEESSALFYLANPTLLSPIKEAILIKNGSWGPSDGVNRLDGPRPLSRQAFANAALFGRKKNLTDPAGLGTIFVWASGNGGAAKEDANCDGYANSIYVIAVGAVDGQGRVPRYSETGACLAVCAPSTSEENPVLISTDRLGSAGYNPPSSGNRTDLEDTSYTRYFGGTSAAAAQVSGVCALMLEANPNLSWRDVKEILIRSARQINPASPMWFTNAAGIPFHPYHGAGLADASAAVGMARSWSKLGPMLLETANSTTQGDIPDESPAGLSRTFEITHGRRVEHVTLKAKIRHNFRGDLRITLTSPNGTTSVLARDYYSESSSGQNNYAWGGGSFAEQDGWTFSSVQFWGERASGVWTLKMEDVYGEGVGTFISAELAVWGSEAPLAPVFTSKSSGQTLVGSAFSHAVTIANGPVLLELVGALPPELQFNAETGLLSGTFEQSGTYHLKFLATNEDGTATQDYWLKVLTPFENWAVQQGLASGQAGPEDDPDNDQTPNLFEYALGTPPLQPNEAPPAGLSLSSSRLAAFTFRRAAAPPAVTWIVERSRDLSSWETIAISQGGHPAQSLLGQAYTATETPLPGGMVEVRVQERAASSQGWSFRLKALAQP